ncbi:unnamed protein product [Protopolystoma xenopodis]|uniref:Uncharacterized protein n=1 Tax=Protopolystoma xenopodis TaxID=117903 RepID=A0A448X9M4_9PLAT|nr:unnamed protein product [Protopolystoma xenopodis]
MALYASTINNNPFYSSGSPALVSSEANMFQQLPQNCSPYLGEFIAFYINNHLAFATQTQF